MHNFSTYGDERNATLAGTLSYNSW